MKIDIAIYDGFDELDAIGPYEVLRHAARMGGGLQVRLTTLTPQSRVTASGGLAVVPQGLLRAPLDWALVPGGGWADHAAQGAWAEIARGTLPKALAKLHQGGTRLASICTGAMLLSAAGLLRGRHATTHRCALEALAEQGAQAVRARVVDDGDILTAGGVTSGLDLALYLVERLCGADLAAAVALEMEYAPHGSVLRGPGADADALKASGKGIP